MHGGHQLSKPMKASPDCPVQESQKPVPWFVFCNTSRGLVGAPVSSKFKIVHKSPQEDLVSGVAPHRMQYLCSHFLTRLCVGPFFCDST